MEGGKALVDDTGDADRGRVGVLQEGAEGVGMKSLLSSLGLKVEVRTWTDSNAATAKASRRGSGKSRNSSSRNVRGGRKKRPIQEG